MSSLTDIILYSDYLAHSIQTSGYYTLVVKGNKDADPNIDYTVVYPLVQFQNRVIPTNIDTYTNYTGSLRFTDLADNRFAGIFIHSNTGPAFYFDAYTNINGYRFSLHDTTQTLLNLQPNVTGTYYRRGTVSMPICNSDNPLSLRNNYHELLIDSKSIGATVTDLRGVLTGIKLNENNNISTQGELYSPAYTVTGSTNHYAYTWIDGTIVDIVLPPGSYTLASLTTYIKNLMIANKHCPLDALGNPVTMFEFYSSKKVTGTATTRVYFVPSATTKKTWTIPPGATWTWPTDDKYPLFEVFGNNALLGIGYGGYQFPYNGGLVSSNYGSDADGYYSFFENTNDTSPLIGGVYLGLSSANLLLNKTTLGTSVINSSLTSVGTLTSLTVSGNINGTLATAAQPNITSVGTLTNVNTSGVYRINGTDFVASRNTNSVAVGASAGTTSQGSSAVAIGYNAGNNTQGSSAVAVGYNAGSNTQGASAIAVGLDAGRNTQGNNAVAIGNGAGTTSQSLQAVCIGLNSGASNQGQQSIAIGTSAGNTSQSSNSIAVGAAAGNSSQGNNCVAVGTNAGQYTQAPSAVAIGLNAGTGTSTAGTGQGSNAVAIGNSAGNNTQGASAIAIGQNAGLTSQGSNAVAIGTSAGNNTQGSSAVAVGLFAGYASQALSTVAIGEGAGQNTQSVNSVAVGSLAGLNAQGANSVAIGRVAGNESQSSSTVAIGRGAGRYYQGGYGVAVGDGAGGGTATAGTGQGANAVAVGYNAGSNTQGQYSVAVGYAAGQTTQANGCVAIGDSAGNTGQGSVAVAVGRYAGQTNQHANSVILNASGAALNSDGTSRFFVKPIRNNTTATSLVQYDSTSGEITYGPSNIGGTLTTAAQPNVTSVGTLGSLTVSGAASAGTLSLQSIPSATTSNMLYYDTSTKAVSYGMPAAVSSFWLASNTQVVSGESFTVKNLGSLTLSAGTYLLHVHGQSSGAGQTKAEIALSNNSTSLPYDPKNGYPYAAWSTNYVDLLSASCVVTISSSTTFYLNARLISASLSTEFTCWVANKCGVTATRLG